MAYEGLAKDIAEGTDVGKIREFRFNIQGEAEGAFYLEVRDGKALLLKEAGRSVL